MRFHPKTQPAPDSFVPPTDNFTGMFEFNPLKRTCNHFMYRQQQRIEFLDSIRGLAALFVLLGHSVGAFEWPALFSAPRNWPFISILFDGKAAVAMFFILSGYVLSKPYVKTEDAPPPRAIFLPTFYLRRFIRIWLPWFFVFIISLLAQRFLFSHFATQPVISEWLNGFWHSNPTVPDFLRQCLFSLHDATRQLLPQDWSLGVELKGSALIPLFVICARQKYQIFNFLLAVLLVIFTHMGGCYVAFIIGVLVAQYDFQWNTLVSRLGRRARMAIFLGGLVLYQGSKAQDSWAICQGPIASQYGIIVTAIGCAVILVSVLGSQTLQRILNHRAIIFLGRISFSVYLLQFIIILCLLPPLVATLNQLGITQPWFLFLATMIASVAATVGCAAVMYRFIELPVIDFGHWITKKIQKRFQK
jgi:peptidoglycan/LPS O-acetylase OafA/YrhL